MSFQLFVIRHGATAWNQEKRLQGRQDITLSEEGIKELKQSRIPCQFTNYRWYCSPLKRARQSAELLGVKEYKIERAIQEMNWGEWEGQRLPELRQRLGAVMASQEALGIDLHPPGGESPRQVQKRVLQWLGSLPSDEDIGLVCHKGVMRSLVSSALDWNMRQDCPVKINWNQGLLMRWSSDSGLQLIEANIPLAEN